MTTNYIKFNEKQIPTVLQNDQWWIAIKPICELLDVNYTSQLDRIKSHHILSQLYLKRGIVAADGKQRQMLCLPEKYIYGWIFSINSNSPGLVAYQERCYEILYDHFHGALTGRMNTLNQKSKAEKELETLEAQLAEKLKDSEEYKRIQELKKEQKQLTKKLKDLNVQLVRKQLSLDF
jgi:hypothetical protein